MNPQKIAIIGSGISGLTAAHLLSREHEVTVFESNDYIGGHTHTVRVEQEGNSFLVDTGFIVCNDRNYPNFLKLMEQLNVRVQPTDMSFSVRNNSINLEYNGHSANTLFSQRSNLLRPYFYKLIGEILRFNKTSKLAIEEGSISAITLNEFIAQHQFSGVFSENYLLPMTAAIWSCNVYQAGNFPLEFFLKFFHNHGLLDIKNRPQWYVLQDGSSSYIEPMTASFRDRIKLNTPALEVLRTDELIKVLTPGRVEEFDQLIMACHSDQALKLLHQPTVNEERILGAMRYQDNEVILHNDESLMPRKPLSWGSWNFLVGKAEVNEPPVVTYCMNILQGLKSSDPLLVSLNSRDKLDPKKVLQEFSYAHPVFSREFMAAQKRRDEICGIDRIHYCGAYWYSGFHEDGVRSALDVCKRFGLTL
jgi:predicted NAD/FAD-binding protein